MGEEIVCWRMSECVRPSTMSISGRNLIRERRGTDGRSQAGRRVEPSPSGRSCEGIHDSIKATQATIKDSLLDEADRLVMACNVGRLKCRVGTRT